MSLDPTKPSRFGRSRARTGCLTCVKRHVKCDERKPSCLKCVRAGRVCESRPDTQSPGHLRIVQYVSTPDRALTSWALRDINELRYFDFFRLRTVAELSGAHSKEHWSTLTLQVAATEPAIWHAVLALAAVHEQFVASSSVLLHNVNLTFAMAHYGRAINTLMASIQASSYVSKDTPLLACALFCAFESMCYHLHSALSHITSGLKLLLELEDTMGTAGRTPRHVSSLLPLFTRLDTQRLQLGDSAFLSDSRLRPVDENLHSLRDFGDMQYTFDRLLNRLHHEINAQETDQKSGVNFDGSRPRRSHLTNISSSYRGWRSAFDRLVRDELPLADLPSVILLQLWRLLVDIMLCLDLRQGELAFDRFEMEFDMIVRLAESFLRLSTPEFGDVMASKQPDRIISDLTAKQHSKLGPMKRHCTKTRTEHMRSGFLGIHPSRTPLIKGLSGDRETAIETTDYLLLRHRERPDREAAGHVVNAGSTFMKPAFSFSHGIIYPLWITITRCRNMKIRSAAWKLMVLCNRREGLWDSELSAKLGLRIIQIENARTLLQGEASQRVSTSSPSSILQDQGVWIPNEARIRRVKPTFLANRKSIELYYLGWSGAFDEAGEADEVWYEDHIEW